MTELSVVVPTVKPRDEVECIEYLRNDEFSDFEVIVRGDETATKARNEGIKRAASDKIVFLDDDSRPREGYLEEASKILDEEAAIAGRIVHPRDDIFSTYFTSHYDQGSAGYVDYFWGCNMALRREVFDAVGMWDENISWGHEEKELADRVRREYNIYYDPDLVVDHCYAESILDFWRKKYELSLEAPYYWDKKNIPKSRQIGTILGSVLSPEQYAGWTVTHAITRSGGNLAKNAGRVKGLIDGCRESE